jgi:hypothetical protein
LGSKDGYRSGLDWMAVMDLTHAIEQLHGVSVNLVMSLDGVYKPYRLQVVAVAEKEQGVATGLRRSVSRKRFFPTVEAETLEGLVFRLLHELDRDCGAMWLQTELYPIA